MPEPRNGIRFRLRGTWESVDLGLMMLRRYAGYLALFFVVPFGFAVAVASIVSEATQQPLWGIAIVWWLKPLWGRLVVLPSSVLAFRPQASVREVAASLRSLFHPSLWAALTYLRFDVSRSAIEPASLLEGLHGSDLRTRKSNLRKSIGGAGAGLTFTFLTIELGLYFSFYPLLGAIAPSLAEPLLFQSLEAGAYFVPVVVGAACTAIVEPLYALGGFGLYLNRRTLVEGWDIELTFRSMKRRLSGPGAALVAFAVFAFASPSLSWSQDRNQETWKESAKSVLADEEFGTEKSQWTLVEKQVEKTPEQQKTIEFAPVQTTGFSWGVVAIACVVLAGALVWIVVAIVRRRPASAHDEIAPPSSQTSQESTPALGEDVLDWRIVVTDLVGSGEYREALALLYRTGLDRAGGNAQFPQWATEEDCLNLVLKRLDSDAAKRSTLERLLHLWTIVAWAQRPVEGHEILRLRDDLSSWAGPS